MPVVRAILFDFGGTLDGPRYWLDRFLRLYHANGIRLSRDQLDPAYQWAGENLPRRSIAKFGLAELVECLIDRQIEYLMRCGPEAVRSELNENAIGHDAIAARIAESFVAQSRSSLAENRTVLEALAGRYKLGVVSNFYGNLDRILAEAGLDRLLSVALDSERVGFRKPDPRIFQLALDSLAVAAHETAMVGDNLAKDCAPAKRLGLTTVWYAPDAAERDAIRRDAAAIPDLTICRLSDLINLKW